MPWRRFSTGAVGHCHQRRIGRKLERPCDQAASLGQLGLPELSDAGVVDSPAVHADHEGRGPRCTHPAATSNCALPSAGPAA